MKKMIIFLSISVMVILSACSNNESKDNNGESKEQDGIVAKINGEFISKEEFYQQLKDMHGEDTLKLMISNIIIEEEVKKSDISIPEEKVNKEIKSLQEKYGGKESFEQFISQNGDTIDDVRKDIIVNLTLDEILKENIKITEEEVRKTYEEHKEAFVLIESGEQQSFEEVKEDIKKDLMERKMRDAYNDWMNKKIVEYKVEFLLNEKPKNS